MSLCTNSVPLFSVTSPKSVSEHLLGDPGPRGEDVEMNVSRYQLLQLMVGRAI